MDKPTPPNWDEERERAKNAVSPTDSNRPPLVERIEGGSKKKTKKPFQMKKKILPVKDVGTSRFSARYVMFIAMAISAIIVVISIFDSTSNKGEKKIESREDSSSISKQRTSPQPKPTQMEAAQQSPPTSTVTQQQGLAQLAPQKPASVAQPSAAAQQNVVASRPSDPCVYSYSDRGKAAKTCPQGREMVLTAPTPEERERGAKDWSAFTILVSRGDEVVGKYMLWDENGRPLCRTTSDHPSLNEVTFPNTPCSEVFRETVGAGRTFWIAFMDPVRVTKIK